MGFAAFFGYLLLSAGPLTAVYLFCVATKSFLVLLSLGSAFYWLLVLFFISIFFIGFEPLDPSIGPYVGLLLVAVLIEEAFRFLLWRFHRLSLRALEYITTETEHAGASVTVSDHFSLSFTHGLAHSAVHALFFCISWLPLSYGNGTIYADTCPQMSFFLVNALNSLAFAGILTGGMMISFEGLERNDYKQGLAASGAHLLAALITLINFSQNGCLISVPLLLLEGAGVAVWAAVIWWRKTGEALRRRANSASGMAARSPPGAPLHES